MRRQAAAEAKQYARLLKKEIERQTPAPPEVQARRAEIYGDTPGAEAQIAKLRSHRTAKTLAEGRKKKAPKPNKTGKQICVRLAADVEEFAISHTPLAAWINELIRREMNATQTNENNENEIQN